MPRRWARKVVGQGAQGPKKGDVRKKAAPMAAFGAETFSEQEPLSVGFRLNPKSDSIPERDGRLAAVGGSNPGNRSTLQRNESVGLKSKPGWWQH
jgi:hypothetical protein